MNSTPLTCESCGMPLDSGRYCSHCTDEQGYLQDFDTRFAAMVAWQLRRDPGASPADVEAATRAQLATMPAWKNHPKLVGNAGAAGSW